MSIPVSIPVRMNSGGKVSGHTHWSRAVRQLTAESAAQEVIDAAPPPMMSLHFNDVI